MQRIALLALTLIAFGAHAAESRVVTEEQQRLAELAGLWNVRQSVWPTPGATPQVDAGTAVFTTELAGRHLRQDLRVSSSTPFQGLGYMGFDVATQTYYATWLDINLTGVLVMHGDYDAGLRTYRLRGALAFERGQAAIPTREEVRIIDADHFVTRFYETRDGKEALVVELAYSR